MSLKVVSINIEGDKHLDIVADFLAREQADIVCLMEVCQKDVLQIAGQRYPFVVFAPNDVLGNIDGKEGLEPTGVAILSKEIALNVEKEYFGEKPRKDIVERGSGSHAPVMLTATFGRLRLAALHFTWTKKGRVSIEQTNHLERLLQLLEGKELLMCGDFNIPRGNENYFKLARKYKDNIPKDIQSTLDPILHYANQAEAGKLKLVVDYVFSTTKYKVSEVRVVSGVSDHCAIVCTISLV